MIEQNASPEVETFINGINSANIIEKDFLLQKEALAEAQGTSATGINQLTGGSGILGWLSGIFNKLSTSVAVTGTFFQAIQPVSGSVTANAGTNLNTSTLALESGGNLAAILVNTSKNQYDTNGNQQVNLNTANFYEYNKQYRFNPRYKNRCTESIGLFGRGNIFCGGFELEERH